MKSLFERISANTDELRIVRVKNAVELAADASFAEILKYRREFLERVNKLEQCLDLGQTSTTDIASNLQKFNPTEWASNLHELIGEISARAEKINCRVRIHNSLFPENTIDLINSNSYDGIVSLILKDYDINRSNTTRKK